MSRTLGERRHKVRTQARAHEALRDAAPLLSSAEDSGVQPGKAAELRMHARARPRRTRNACAAGVQKWRFAGVETAPPCPPESLRAWLPVPWSLSTLIASVRRSQRLLRSFWWHTHRELCRPTSTLSRPTIWGWSLGGIPQSLCAALRDLIFA